jgi:ribose/xylose/arabinose/galactoside ABC-type transport system permease subunit
MSSTVPTTSPAKSPRTATSWRARVPWSQLGLPLVLLALCLVFGAMNPHFWSQTNLTNVSRQAAVLALLSIGMTFAIISAGIDLSVGSVVALTSVVGAQVMLDHGLTAGLIAGLLVGCATGLINGFVIARMRLPPFIATLGMLVAARGLALTLSGGMPISGLPEGLFVLGGGYIGPLPVPTLIAIVAFVVAWLVLRRTQFGRYVYAIGSNEEAALLSGIRVVKTKIWVYVVSGFFAAVAGIVLTSRVSSGQPTLGEVQELYAIAAVVIGGSRITGGVGGVGRTLLGVLILSVLSNGLNLTQVSSYVQNIVIGVIIVAAVYVDLNRNKAR